MANLDPTLPTFAVPAVGYAGVAVTLRAAGLDSTAETLTYTWTVTRPGAATQTLFTILIDHVGQLRFTEPVDEIEHGFRAPITHAHVGRCGGTQREAARLVVELQAGNTKCPQLSCLHMRQGRVLVDEHHGDFVAQNRLHHGAATPVRDAGQENACGLLEQLHGHVAAGRMGVAVVQFAGVAFGKSHQVSHGFEGLLRVHHQHIGPLVDLREVNEIGDRVVLEVGIEPMGHRVLAHARLNEGVAIGGALHRAVSANGAARATHVFHHHGLAQRSAKRLGHQARHHIAGATRGEWADEFDGFVGKIGLGPGCWQEQRCRTCAPA